MRRVWVFVTVIAFLSLSTMASAYSNVALNADVTLNGTFFTGGWGGGTTVGAETVVDGIFLPQSHQWDQGAVWWDANLSPNNSIELDLGGIFSIDSFVVQGDDNDAYLLEYHNLTTDSWEVAWNVPNYNVYMGSDLWGMQTRPNPADDLARYFILPDYITTDMLRISGNPYDSDRLFAVSEIQAYGTPVPEPSTMLLLGSGLTGLVVARRRKK